MTATVHFNRKAGSVTMRVTERARVLSHQCEAGCELEAMMAGVREAVSRLVEVHAAAKRAQSELVSANRLVSDAEFVAPEAVAS